jgi:hypothetical protein
VLLSLPLATTLADFSQSQAKPRLFAASTPSMALLKPLHFINMGPMSDVTMMKLLCVTDFGHVICAGKMFGRF